MSAIVGIVATHNTVPGLLQSLQHMEQASHNNCGLVVHGRQGQSQSPPRLHRHRRAQRVSAWMEQMTQSGKADLNGLQGFMGMGHSGQTHTTGSHALNHVLPQISHGTDAHLNSPARIAVVLSGQVQATPSLREVLIERGYPFKSQSAAELIAHLIDATYQNDPVQALHRTMGLLQGPLAMGVIFHDQAERLFAVQRDSALYGFHGPQYTGWTNDKNAMGTPTMAMLPLENNQVLEIQTLKNRISSKIHN